MDYFHSKDDSKASFYASFILKKKTDFTMLNKTANDIVLEYDNK